MEPDGQNLVLLNASLITITPLAVSEGEAVTLDELDVIKGLSQDDYVLVASSDSGFELMDRHQEQLQEAHLRHHRCGHRPASCRRPSCSPRPTSRAPRSRSTAVLPR